MEPFLQRCAECTYLSGVYLVGGGVRDVSGVGRLGSGERSWDLRAFTLIMLTCPRKVINGNCEKGCIGESLPKKSSLSG